MHIRAHAKNTQSMFTGSKSAKSLDVRDRTEGIPNKYSGSIKSPDERGFRRTTGRAPGAGRT